jgi:hypothetical protein
MLRRFSLTRLFVVFVASLACLVAMSGQAFAEQVAGLKFETGQIDSDLADELRAQVGEAFEGVDRWSFVEFRTARAKMNPITRDCFTSDCLTKAGTAVGAPAGLSIKISGEAEIYDWTIKIWDLREGKKLQTEEGACELCGDTEVKRTFLASLKSALVSTALPGQADAPPRQDAPPAQDTQPPGPGQVSLRISAVPEDAEIYINDQFAGEGEVTRNVGAGTHEVGFQREGYGGLTETVVVNEETDGPVLLRVHLSRTDPETVTLSSGTGAIDRLGESRTTFGWIATGTGAVLLGTGIYLTSIDGETSCDDNVAPTQCPEVYATGGAGMTMGVLGTALLTSGVGLLTWEILAGETSEVEADEQELGPADEEMQGPGSVSVSPIFGPDAAGVFLRATF